MQKIAIFNHAQLMVDLLIGLHTVLARVHVVGEVKSDIDFAQSLRQNSVENHALDQMMKQDNVTCDHALLTVGLQRGVHIMLVRRHVGQENKLDIDTVQIQLRNTAEKDVLILLKNQENVMLYLVLLMGDLVNGRVSASALNLVEGDLNPGRGIAPAQNQRTTGKVARASRSKAENATQ